MIITLDTDDAQRLEINVTKRGPSVPGSAHIRINDYDVSGLGTQAEVLNHHETAGPLVLAAEALDVLSRTSCNKKA